MSRLINKQPNRERKRISRCVLRRNHCGLSLSETLDKDRASLIVEITNAYLVARIAMHLHYLPITPSTPTQLLVGLCASIYLCVHIVM